MMKSVRHTARVITRLGAIAVGAATVLLGIQAHGQSQPIARRDVREATFAAPSRPAVSAASRGLSHLLAGDRAVNRGDLAAADGAYREAWQDPFARRQAAASLHNLHKLPEFQLTADEDSVGNTWRQLGPNFARTETAHFVILSDCPPEWVRIRAELLERTRDQVFRVAAQLNVPVYPHPNKLLCVLINDHGQYRAFARAHDGLEARWIAGYYATLSNRVVFYNDETSPAYQRQRSRLSTYEQQLRDARDRAKAAEQEAQTDLAMRLHGTADELDERIRRERERLDQRATAYSLTKTIHEAVHLLSFNIGLQLPDRDYPFWLSEGMATAFETDTPGEIFGPDIPASQRRESRFHELRENGRMLSLQRLAGLGEVPGSDADLADAMYSQSHVLFTHLYRTSPDALGRFLRTLADEEPGRVSAERHVQLFRDHFGDPAAVARRILRESR
jgi:hypothetical protein